MVKGIGIDIIEIERVKKAVSNENFLKKCYTSKEIELFTTSYMNYNSLAGNFAGKEAVAKALGTGFNKVEPIHIEILRDGVGKPYVTLHENAKEIAHKLNITQILISISHDKTKAISYAIAQ